MPSRTNIRAFCNVYMAVPRYVTMFCVAMALMVAGDRLAWRRHARRPRRRNAR